MTYKNRSLQILLIDYGGIILGILSLVVGSNFLQFYFHLIKLR